MVRKVIVLGGGSAGFIAAAALKFKIPSLQVQVIRSPDIGIIGVGEGSTGSLTLFLRDYMCVNHQKFFEVAKPTWKLGLRFIWGKTPVFQLHLRPATRHSSGTGNPARERILLR